MLRAAEASRPRDRAIVTLLLYTALRLQEVVALDVDDVSISARKGMLVVRSGKGDAHREVPLNASSRKAVDDWLKDRGKPTGEDCSSDRVACVLRHGRSIVSFVASRIALGLSSRRMSFGTRA